MPPEKYDAHVRIPRQPFEIEKRRDARQPADGCGTRLPPLWRELTVVNIGQVAVDRMHGQPASSGCLTKRSRVCRMNIDHGCA
jgi:hypothetical protein